MRLRSIASAALLFAAIVAATAARAEDPLLVARAFCSADGNGDRLSPYEWRQIAPLVSWRLEPAWDRLVLIRGYEISTPHRVGNGLEVEVAYTVVGEITGGGIASGDQGDGEADGEERRETVTLTLVSDGHDGWLVGGAPPPPHVFDNVVDAETLAELLLPETAYESNSAFVWRGLRAAGWDIPYATTATIPDSPHFQEVATAAPGDLALYYAHGAPYHVGLVEAVGTVLSSSLNAGPVVAPFAAFPGSIQYWRPRRPEDAVAPAPDTTPSPLPLRRRRP